METTVLIKHREVPNLSSPHPLHQPKCDSLGHLARDSCFSFLVGDRSCHTRNTNRWHCLKFSICTETVLHTCCPPDEGQQHATCHEVTGAAVLTQPCISCVVVGKSLNCSPWLRTARPGRYRKHPLSEEQRSYQASTKFPPWHRPTCLPTPP